MMSSEVGIGLMYAAVLMPKTDWRPGLELDKFRLAKALANILGVVHCGRQGPIRRVANETVGANALKQRKDLYADWKRRQG
jgi:hypothetical protein